jgi:hypothetical protein
MRWKYNHGEVQTNSRLVQWSDGTYGVYVGANYFEIKGSDVDNEMLYTVQDDVVMVNQQAIDHSGELRDPIDNTETKVKNALPTDYTEENWKKRKAT